MNDWEQHANLSLQSLGDAYLRGHIDRGEFRARRRRILQGIRERQAQTQPNALHAASHAPSPVAAYPSRSAAGAGAAPPPAAHAVVSRRPGRLAAAAACAIIVAGLIAWWWLRRAG